MNWSSLCVTLLTWSLVVIWVFGDGLGTEKGVAKTGEEGDVDSVDVMEEEDDDDTHVYVNDDDDDVDDDDDDKASFS